MIEKCSETETMEQLCKGKGFFAICIRYDE
jgi:hypothetical protein